jgi:azurin
MLSVLLASLLVAQSDAPTKATPRTVDLSATDKMKYSVTRITATRGETLRIVLSVAGKMPKQVMAHNVVVLGKGVNAAKVNAAAALARESEFIPPAHRADIVAHTGLAGNGETVEVTFVVPQQTGNYEFICTFPGHFNLGMKGVLVVQ